MPKIKDKLFTIDLTIAVPGDFSFFESDPAYDTGCIVDLIVDLLYDVDDLKIISLSVKEGD